MWEYKFGAPIKLICLVLLIKSRGGTLRIDVKLDWIEQTVTLEYIDLGGHIEKP